jgi:RHS repeat-associated protein
VWGRYVDELVQMKTYVDTGSQPLPASTYYPQSDLLYRSEALTDASGDIKEAYDTDAYGNTLMFSGPGGDDTWFTDDDTTSDQPACEYLFTGREYDPESQIYFYRARYYHPLLGRFVSRDPIIRVMTLNFYQMVLSNPLIFVDPTGKTVSITGNSISVTKSFDLTVFDVELAGYTISGNGGWSVSSTSDPQAQCKTPLTLTSPIWGPPTINFDFSNDSVSLSQGVVEGPVASTIEIGISFPSWSVMSVTTIVTAGMSYKWWDSKCGCQELDVGLRLSGAGRLDGPLALAAYAVFVFAPEADVAAAGVTAGLAALDIGYDTLLALIARLAAS